MYSSSFKHISHHFSSPLVWLQARNKKKRKIIIIITKKKKKNGKVVQYTRREKDQTPDQMERKRNTTAYKNKTRYREREIAQGKSFFNV
jgi:hypothetical protein